MAMGIFLALNSSSYELLFDQIGHFGGFLYGVSVGLFVLPVMLYDSDAFNSGLNQKNCKNLSNKRIWGFILTLFGYVGTFTLFYTARDIRWKPIYSD